MKIIKAESAGFCPGVKRAVDCVNELLGGVRRVYTLGMLIHNPPLVSSLEARGLKVIGEEELDAVAASAKEGDEVCVVIRAHGVTKEVEEKLSSLKAINPAFDYIDMTCPYVKKIHKIAHEETKNGAFLAVLGNEEHPEVRGIVSRSQGEYAVGGDAEAILAAIDGKNEVILVSQTTGSLKEWKKTQKYLKNLSTNAKIFDTICGVTEKRQTEAEKIAKEADMMIVVGSLQSSNTKKLFDVCRSVCPLSYLIEDKRELPPVLTKTALGGIKILGITAGASTPGGIIEEVIKTMSEIEKNEAVETTEQESGENFAQMLDESFKTLNTGDIVKGIVTSVSPNELHVDLSAKVTGIVPFDEITDDSTVKLADLYKVGDEIEAQAFRVSDVDGVATLSIKRIAKIQGWREVVAAEQSGEILEGKVTEIVKGGVIVNHKHTKVFIPERQSGVAKDGDLSALKGQVVRFRIIEVNTERNRAVGSIRSVEREERRAKLDEFWAELEEGKKFTGKVKSLTSYGAFVDLGGIDGMVHASELSWTHIKNPADVVSIGDEIDVYVKSFDREKKRISLGYKTEENNPFNIFLAKYQIGDVADVKIVSLTTFGAFAQIVPGVDGLIHISQIANKKIEHPSSELTVGQEVQAKITDIDTEKQKVSLSIRALLAEEAPAEEAAAEEAPADAE